MEIVSQKEMRRHYRYRCNSGFQRWFSLSLLQTDYFCITIQETPPLTSSNSDHHQISLFHRLFDKLYPIIRFTYERILAHDWFSKVTPQLWLGGAPTYRRDYELLLDHGIGAVVNIRAERQDETAYYDLHHISHVQYKVPDVSVPDQAVITEAVGWIRDEVQEGRVVLVHCAKGRGRSATLLAAYLMREEGMSFDEANQLLKSKRPLTKLQSKHKAVLESWMKTQM